MNTSRFFFVCLSVLLIATASLWRCKLSDASFSSRLTAQEREAKLARVREEVSTLIAEAAHAQQQDVAGTRARVSEILAQARGEANTAAESAAAPFQGFGNVTDCVLMGAKDEVLGGSRFSDYTERAMAPACGLLLKAQGEVQNALEQLRQRTLARVNDLRSRTLSVTHDSGFDLPEVGCDPAQVAHLGAAAEEMMCDATAATVAVAVEAAFIKFTVESIKPVVKHLIEREAASLGVGGGCAAADGPLPIGDIIGAVIAIGGTAWTAWDVGQAVNSYHALPGQIHSLLIQQIGELDREAGVCLDALAAALAQT